uniref:RHD domain-containing protein n=1 Tax=Acrobeloides nanus TaxID=290746 RepID=A0A914D214_9BILA
MASMVDLNYCINDEDLASNILTNPSTIDQNLKSGANVIAACLSTSVPAIHFTYNNQWSNPIWQQCVTEDGNSESLQSTPSDTQCCQDQASQPDEIRPIQMGTLPNTALQVDQTRAQTYQLVVVRQPEEQHRARYLSEGSRGAIKDRSGASYVTIQLTGYYRPTRVEMFAALGSGELLPHPYYQLIPVSGKTSNTTRCRKVVAQDGLQCLEVILRPENQMIATLDCIGILKILTYDSRNKRQSKNAVNMAQSSVRIAFRAYIQNGNSFNILRAETEPIRCVQSLGVPEVLKMSLSSAPASGNTELFIIGRNFDPRSTSVLFREYKEDGNLAWTAEAEIDKQLLHQCHIVCTVPTYGGNPQRGGNVSVTVRCGSKSSHPLNFLYTPMVQQLDDGRDEWCPPEFTCSSNNTENMDDCDSTNEKRSYIQFFESEFASTGMLSRYRNNSDVWDPNVPSVSSRFHTDSSSSPGEAKRRRFNCDM